jgi:hypothetical protein
MKPAPLMVQPTKNPRSPEPMSKSAHQSPPPSPPPKYDAALDDERSAVRARPPHAPHPHASGEHALPMARVAAADSERPTLPSSTRDLVEESERLERKLRFARVVQRLLPSDDSRARLLHTAIARRDEILLDGVLHVLEAGGDLPEAPSNDTAPVARSTPPGSKRPLTVLPPAPDPGAPEETEDFE